MTHYADAKSANARTGIYTLILCTHSEKLNTRQSGGYVQERTEVCFRLVPLLDSFTLHSLRNASRVDTGAIVEKVVAGEASLDTVGGIVESVARRDSDREGSVQEQPDSEGTCSATRYQR